MKKMSIWKHYEGPLEGRVAPLRPSYCLFSWWKYWPVYDQIMGTGVWPNPNETACVRNSYCTFTTPYPKNTQPAYCPKDTPWKCLSPCLFIPHGTLHCESLQQNRKDKTNPWYQARGDRLQHVKLLHNQEISEALRNCTLARTGMNNTNLMSPCGKKLRKAGNF